MCGIAGFYGKYTPSLLNRMGEKISHRGPDGNGEWFSLENQVGLAHRRLSIIDLSPTGAQPMWSSSGRSIITFNGEIYNYQELHKKLLDKGYRLKGTSDTEVLINMYDAYGVDMLPMLNGIFAFAIWDMSEKRLLLARDGAGVKPLYYSFTPSGFCFASEIKSMVLVPDIDKTISKEAIHCYLTYMWCPAPLTPFKHLHKLEPGTAFIVKSGVMEKMWKYYDIPLASKKVPVTVRDAEDQCRSNLAEAVRRQMVADVEVATFLSGGLDSTSVTYYAQQFNKNKKIKSFTMRYNAQEMSQEGLVDDLPYAKIAAERLGVDLRIIDVDFDLFKELPFMLYHLDEPQADPAPLNVYYICKYARENNIKVLLSGSGGDDIFTGYRRHQALFYRALLNFIPSTVFKSLHNCSAYLPEYPALLRRIKKALYSSSFAGGELLESYFKWMRNDIQFSLYNPEFRADIAGNSPVLQTANGLDKNSAFMDRMLFLEMKYFLADHNLNYTDKMSMAAGVEVRVPFLDPDLVSFAFSLPAHFKQNGKTGKWILKRAMEPFLPKNLIYRPKTGFGIPLRSMLKNRYEEIVQDYLSKETVARRGLFNHEKVLSLVNLNQNGTIEAGYTIFALICLEVWMRVFVDGCEAGSNL